MSARCAREAGGRTSRSWSSLTARLTTPPQEGTVESELTLATAHGTDLQDSALTQLVFLVGQLGAEAEAPRDGRVHPARAAQQLEQVVEHGGGLRESRSQSAEKCGAVQVAGSRVCRAVVSLRCENACYSAASPDLDLPPG
jgi:hypothetical protein